MTETNSPFVSCEALTHLAAPGLPTAVSAAMRLAFTVGPLKAKLGLGVYFEERLRTVHELPCAEVDDSILFFLPKRSDAVVNRWLQNAKLAVLSPLSPQGTGCVLITRERIDHVRQHRDNQNVSVDAVHDLFKELFVEGAASFAWNQSSGANGAGYEHQLMMFKDSYKSKRTEVSGASPAAVLSYRSGPSTVLSIETAYWVRDHKAKALRKGALA